MGLISRNFSRPPWDKWGDTVHKSQLLVGNVNEQYIAPGFGQVQSGPDAADTTADHQHTPVSGRDIF
jgi:hypothetical protein